GGARRLAPVAGEAAAAQPPEGAGRDQARRARRSRRMKAARRTAGGLLLASLTALAGCGSFWPWSSSAPKMPEPPPVTAPVAASQPWSLRLGAAAQGFSPVYAGGSVFAAAADGTVVRVDPDK